MMWGSLQKINIFYAPDSYHRYRSREKKKILEEKIESLAKTYHGKTGLNIEHHKIPTHSPSPSSSSASSSSASPSSSAASGLPKTHIA
jgi:hypothetical protein